MPLPEIPGRREIIQEHVAKGGRVAAVFPIHYPRALLRAHGVLPVEMWGPGGFDADQHLQAYTCAVVRSSLGFILSEQGKKAADLFLVPHCCDSAQGLASVLIDFSPPGKPVLTFYPPRGEGEAAAQYLVEELRRLSVRLAEIAGQRPTDDELVASVEREEEADAALRALVEARPTSALSNSEFYRLARAREYLPAERFTPIARKALESPAGANGEVPILLSGILPEPAQVLVELDRLKARIVADDLACVGRRLYPPTKGADPLRRMADALQGGPPDSTRGAFLQRRAAHLVNLARTTGAKAAVFFLVKFCEPEQFYLPELRKALEAEGIRSVAIELHPNEPLPEQAVTRIEALLETQS